MKLKDIFLGILIVALIASELLLFSANQQKRDALSKLGQAQQQAKLAQAQLNQAQTTSDAATTQLRTDNQSLLQKNAQLQAENQQLKQQLGTARTAVQMQRQHLDQLQTENQAPAVDTSRDACIANLHAIQVAKAEWALENNKTANDIPTEQDLAVYLTGGAMPTCPGGGTYSINAAGLPPTCSIPGHALPQQ